jgi:tetrahydromethanopterin S-methyltransferase subunit A
MKMTLEELRASLSSYKKEIFLPLITDIENFLQQIEQVKYDCLRCKYCFPVVAMNKFNETFPEIISSRSLICSFEAGEKTWPPVAGDYFVFCDGPNCPVAVSTLGSVELAEALAKNRPRELCIVGKTETENIGIEKVIKNIISNPTIRILLLAGKDPEGHRSGATLLALWKNGIDENMRVINSPGRRPILKNVTKEEVEVFRKQIYVVDMIGCEDEAKIVEKIKEVSQNLSAFNIKDQTENNLVKILTPPIVQAKEPVKIKMDKAGYFVIIPQPEKRVIVVEHYSYDNKLLRIIEGKDARSLYHTIIENGWVTELSHAAYLGKELAKAELSLKLGFKYVQDAA